MYFQAFKLIALILLSVLISTKHTSAGGIGNYVPQEIKLSYFGEQISHPGIAIGMLHELKTAPKGEQFVKQWNLNTSLSFFFHRRYQASLNFIPEIQRRRINKNKGNYRAWGVGAGYMMNLVPRVFSFNIIETLSGPSIRAQHKAAVSFSFEFGKDPLYTSKKWGHFIKPQFLYAIPGYPMGTGYFILEAGVHIKLTNIEIINYD